MGNSTLQSNRFSIIPSYLCCDNCPLELLWMMTSYAEALMGRFILVMNEDENMAQRKPEEKATLDEVLILACQLSPEDQAVISEEFEKLQWLRRKMAEAESSLDRGEGIPAEQAFAELEERYRRKKAGK